VTIVKVSNTFDRYMKNIYAILVMYLYWLIASLVAVLLRFDGEFPTEKLDQILLLSLFGGPLNIFLIFILAKNQVRYRIASVEEVFAITVSVSIVTIILTTLRIVFDYPSLPRSVPLISGLIALIIQFFSRLLVRRKSYKDMYTRTGRINTLIYGAGITGRQLVEQMFSKPSEFRPIGFLDDDVSNHKLKIYGRKIFGGLEKLEEVVLNFEINNLIIAISEISGEKLIEIEQRCKQLNISLKIIPNSFDILTKNLQVSDFSDISEEDLLGRRQYIPNESEISRFLSNKRILITGAGGSIGSEIARQIFRFNHEDLYLLDRDENALLKIQLDLIGDGLLAHNNLILADIRDFQRISDIVESLKPDIIFHAAALKHLAILEKYPEEAIKTNVDGTRNLIQSALKSNIKYFVNISTDKAADPISQLGRSKLLTERMIANVIDEEKVYISVRFGNVIGSNGSFLNTFRYQIRKGGPIKVTHPDITRYFMTVGEAVHLVLQSVLVGESGETLILEMGNPVSINSVAEYMIKISGKKIEIEYTGLRNGEKLHEVLIGKDEITSHGNHKAIIHTRVKPLDESKT
jgi:FlaA1/EpsC-like NDP-sugar epimerase